MKDNAEALWLVSVQPNEVGLMTVTLAEGKDSTHGFAVTLQDLMSYGAFRAACRRFGIGFRYYLAEGEGGEAAWLALLRKCVAYPERRLTDKWGECCPGSTRRGRLLQGLAV